MDKYFWFTLALVLFIAEIMTPGVFFFSCLGVGALLTGIFLVLFPGQITVGWIVFVISSVLVVYFVRPVVKKLFVKESVKSNVDALVGQRALVVENIEPPHFGLVKVAGELWRAESDATVEVGQFVEVYGVNGTHLKVRKI